MKAYPNAVSFGCEGLDRKRPDLAFQHALGPVFDALVGDTLKRFPIAGIPKINETLFFHPASHTLIATDFCFFMPKATGATWLYGKMMGFHTQPNCPPLVKWMVRNQAEFRNSLTPLRALRVQHLSMCHHAIVSENAQAAFSQVLDRLGVPSTQDG